MASSSTNSSIDGQVKGKTKDLYFYGGDTDTWHPMITTYDMKMAIQIVHCTSEVIGDNNEYACIKFDLCHCRVGVPHFGDGDSMCKKIPTR